MFSLLFLFNSSKLDVIKLKNIDSVINKFPIYAIMGVWCCGKNMSYGAMHTGFQTSTWLLLSLEHYTMYMSILSVHWGYKQESELCTKTQFEANRNNVRFASKVLEYQIL